MRAAGYLAYGMCIQALHSTTVLSREMGRRCTAGSRFERVLVHWRAPRSASAGRGTGLTPIRFFSTVLCAGQEHRADPQHADVTWHNTVTPRTHGHRVRWRTRCAQPNQRQQSKRPCPLQAAACLVQTGPHDARETWT